MVNLILIILIIIVILPEKEGFTNNIKNLFIKRALWIKVLIEDSMQNKVDKGYIFDELLKINDAISEYMPNKKYVKIELKNNIYLIRSLLNQIQTQNKNEIEIAKKELEKNTDRIIELSKGHIQKNILENYFKNDNRLIYDMAINHYYSLHEEEVIQTNKFLDNSLSFASYLMS